MTLTASIDIVNLDLIGFLLNGSGEIKTAEGKRWYLKPSAD